MANKDFHNTVRAVFYLPLLFCCHCHPQYTKLQIWAVTLVF